MQACSACCNLLGVGGESLRLVGCGDFAFTSAIVLALVDRLLARVEDEPLDGAIELYANCHYAAAG